ncbi:MAG: LysR family transcriptional regulator [Bacteroidales bacterium]|nr:LysR family transcriptional regulator [Bacteroidales bacterium]
MTDNRLKIFVAVAETGGFTSAAHKLKMSQPAVSQNVALMEEEAGGALFERGANPLKLTEKGRTFHAYAIRILSLYDSLAAELSGAPGSAAERSRLDLGDGRQADISVADGKLVIDIK